MAKEQRKITETYSFFKPLILPKIPAIEENISPAKTKVKVNIEYSDLEMPIAKRRPDIIGSTFQAMPIKKQAEHIIIILEAFWFM